MSSDVSSRSLPQFLLLFTEYFKFRIEAVSTVLGAIRTRLDAIGTSRWDEFVDSFESLVHLLETSLQG